MLPDIVDADFIPRAIAAQLIVWRQSILLAKVGSPVVNIGEFPGLRQQIPSSKKHKLVLLAEFYHLCGSLRDDQRSRVSGGSDDLGKRICASADLLCVACT